MRSRSRPGAGRPRRALCAAARGAACPAGTTSSPRLRTQAMATCAKLASDASRTSRSGSTSASCARGSLPGGPRLPKLSPMQGRGPRRLDSVGSQLAARTRPENPTPRDLPINAPRGVAVSGRVREWAFPDVSPSDAGLNETVVAVTRARGGVHSRRAPRRRAAVAAVRRRTQRRGDGLLSGAATGHFGASSAPGPTAA